MEWGVTGGLRRKDGLEELYDRRLGTILGVDLGKGVTASGGYLDRNRKLDGFGFDWNHRVAAGLSYPLLRRGEAKLEGTTLYERHFGRPDVPDFNRYRQQFEPESGKTGFSPWFYQGFVFLRQGFARSRSRLGIQWRSHGGYVLGVAYQFEELRSPATAVRRPRHAIHTTNSIEKPIWKPHR